MATSADWTDPAFQAALVQAHREGKGWALLEEHLLITGSLCVAEGYVRIDGARVVEVGRIARNRFTFYRQLRGVYPAKNFDTMVAWTTTAPALGNNWTVLAWPDQSANPRVPAQWILFDETPCIYVQVHTSIVVHDSYD